MIVDGTEEYNRLNVNRPPSTRLRRLLDRCIICVCVCVCVSTCYTRRNTVRRPSPLHDGGIVVRVTTSQTRATS